MQISHLQRGGSRGILCEGKEVKTLEKEPDDGGGREEGMDVKSQDAKVPPTPQKHKQPNNQTAAGIPNHTQISRFLAVPSQTVGLPRVSPPPTLLSLSPYIPHLLTFSVTPLSTLLNCNHPFLHGQTGQAHQAQVRHQEVALPHQAHPLQQLRLRRQRRRRLFLLLRCR